MNKTKTWCDIIVFIGILLLVIGLFIPHMVFMGSLQQSVVVSIKRTAIGWSLGCTGFSFILLGSVFKLFLKHIEKDLQEIKYQLNRLDRLNQNNEKTN